jgi:hypothetical protein
MHRALAIAILALPALSNGTAGLGIATGSAQDTLRGHVQGTVRERPSGIALVGAVVRLIGTDYTGLTNAEGGFFLPEVRAGRYRITVEHVRTTAGELEPDTLDVRIEPGAVAVIELFAHSRPLGPRTQPRPAVRADQAGPPAAVLPDSLRGTIVGRVRDAGSGRAVSGADVLLARTGDRAVTDGLGRFTFRGAPAGRQTLEVRMLSYATRADTVDLPRGRSMEVEMLLGRDPVKLEPIQVQVRSDWLERSGFYMRRDDPGTFGHFVERNEIERRAVTDLPDLLRSVPSILVEYRGPGRKVVRMKRVTTLTGLPCEPLLYVDGIRMRDAFNDIPPQIIEAVEVYDAANAPLEYGRTACGIILVWTRK